MLKIISKKDCPRCVSIKAYLYERGIDYQEAMAEDQGYDYWRGVVQTYTGKLGFPVLIYTKEEEVGEGKTSLKDEWANGSLDDLQHAIDIWFPLPEKPVQSDPNKDIVYSWGQ